MRRFLLLTACIALLGATAARGDLIDSTHRTGAFPANTLSFTRTLSAYDGYDKIEIHVAASLVGSNTWLSTVEGTWTTVNNLGVPQPSITMYLAGTAGGSTYKSNTKRNSLTGPNPPQAWINFDSVVSGAVAWNTRTGTSPNYSVFGGSWYTSDSTMFLRPVDPSPGDDEHGGDGVDETLMATIYVTHLGGVSFSGKFNAYNPVTFGNTNIVGTFRVDGVPEPSTLVLLAAGLVGLLAYAWRKRR